MEGLNATLKGMETPPRTWRRHVRRRQPRIARGNTSTDVEKTHFLFLRSESSKKHLHGRGEDRRKAKPTIASPETPPRTWRRLRKPILQKQPSRNTSTDVEKTPVYVDSKEKFEKHLHGRGEDSKI